MIATVAVVTTVLLMEKFSNRWYKTKCDIILKNKDNIALKEKDPLLYEFIQDLMEEVEE